jgi:glycosyltransferase involved in cell wall biosynthesis
VRILFLSHYAVPHVGGVETSIEGVAEELARRGHDVVHVASTAGDDPAETPDAYRVVRVPALNVLERRLEVPYPLFHPRLVRVLRREISAVDVVHAHGFLYLPTLVGLPLARRAQNKPVRVLTEHVGHVAYESKVLDRTEALAIGTLGRRSLRDAEAIVVYNERVRDELERLVPGRRIDFIGNGVDVERFRPAKPAERKALREELGWTDGLPRVLFAGRLVAKKGIDLALSVAEEAQGELELVLAGPGELPRAPSPNVRVLGPQPRRELERLYRAADAFLVPSRGEGFPLSVQEAMASGLPVVMCDDPGYRALLEGAGDAVRLTEPHATALAEALHELLGNETARKAAARDAADHAKRAFSWARAADEHEALYERVRSERAG